MKFKDIFFLVGTAVLAVLFILANILIRVNHPELTETQLLIRYWKLWVLNFGSMVLCVSALMRSDS